MKLLFSGELGLLDLALGDEALNEVGLGFLQAIGHNCHSMMWLSTRQEFRQALFRRRFDKGSPLHYLVGWVNRVSHSRKFRFLKEAPFEPRSILVVPDHTKPPPEGDWLFLTAALDRARTER